MRNAFINSISDILKKNKHVMMLNGDAGYKIFKPISSKFKSQYINCGIAEANMITVAVGLAKSGYIPFTYAIGAHVAYRAFEQIRNDVCLNKANVKIVSGGTGLHYADHGPTHHSTEDISILNCIPNLTIFSPSCPFEVSKMTREAIKIKGPVYMRIGRGASTKSEKVFNLKRNTLVKAGTDGVIICTGPTVIIGNNVSKILQEKYKLSFAVLNVHTIKPIEKNTIINISKKVKKVFVIEEHQMIGGLRDIISNIIVSNEIKLKKFFAFGLNDQFCSYNGSYEGIKKKYQLTDKYISQKIYTNLI